MAGRGSRVERTRTATSMPFSPRASRGTSPSQFTSVIADQAGGQGLPGADDHAGLLGVEADDIERLADGQAEALPLADRVVDDALVAAEHAAVEMDDLAALHGARLETLDHVAVAPLRDEADVLAVGLLRDGEPEFARELAGLVLGQFAQGKAQEARAAPAWSHRGNSSGPGPDRPPGAAPGAHPAEPRLAT